MQARWLALACFLPLPAQAQPPLSAIDWLTDPVPVIQSLPGPNDQPIAEGISVPDVDVTPLGDTTTDSVGLLPRSVTGLPASLWQHSDAQRIETLLKAQKLTDLPAMQALFYTLLLAEAEPPKNLAENGAFLAARLERLIALGAVEPAQALLQRAGPTTRALFSHWFNATLLTGDEDTACAELMRTPGLAPSQAARIFCTARMGDWRGAALILNTALVLNTLPAQEATLLQHFLDPETFEGEELPLPPVRPSPLVFRLWEALGEPLPTASLPRAFAVADLRSVTGWKARIEAAERLAQTAALPENRLLGIYSEREPAASGGIWDRVSAIQAFDHALTDRDIRAIERSLPAAWRAVQAARLEVPFARLYAHQISLLPMKAETASLSRLITYLSPDYERNAKGAEKTDFLASIAIGNPSPALANTPKELAIVEGFNAPPLPADISIALSRDQVGESILQAMLLYENATRGETKDLAPALATLRTVGLEDTARQAALQAMLLTRSP